MPRKGLPNTALLQTVRQERPQSLAARAQQHLIGSALLLDLALVQKHHAVTHPVLSSSYMAALLVIETLVTSLMISGDNQVAQAEKLTDAISAYLYTDKSGSDIGSDRPPRRIVRG